MNFSKSTTFNKKGKVSNVLICINFASRVTLNTLLYKSPIYWFCRDLHKLNDMMMCLTCFAHPYFLYC